MTIRPCVASDAESIDAMFREFVTYLRGVGDEHVYRFGGVQYLADGFGQNPAFRGLIAEDESGAIAYVLFSPTYDGDYVRGLYIVDLYVREAWRKRGVGQLLMGAVRNLATQEGLARLSWNVHKDNAGAIRFYEALGAKTVEDAPTMYLDL